MATRTHLNAEQLLADLASDFCERTRHGKGVEMKKYLARCPDDSSRNRFKELVNTDLMLRAVVGIQRQRRTV